MLRGHFRDLNPYSSSVSVSHRHRVLVGFFYVFMICQIILLARDWSKRSTWRNIPQLKQGDIRSFQPSDIPQFSNLTSSLKIWIKLRERFVVITEEDIFVIKFTPENTQKKTSHTSYSKLFVNIFHARCKIFLRIINTKDCILRKNMLVHLSLDVICSSKLTKFTVSILE